MGTRVYMVNCASCHGLESVTNNQESAPSLGMIFNRKVGTDLNFFNYTKSLQDKSFFWTTKNLYNFFANPSSMLPGTSCGLAFKPLKSESDRADLITFLR